jgi:hypothetical protein
MYFETVDWATSKPSFRSSPWMCGAPQSGLRHREETMNIPGLTNDALVALHQLIAEAQTDADLLNYVR